MNLEIFLLIFFLDAALGQFFRDPVTFETSQIHRKSSESPYKYRPILFYPGNEGKIEKFADNTGFMWDLAPELNAAVVFVEHRYYAKSKPFGNESYSNIENLGYLSTSQALADYAFVVQYLKNGKTIPGADKNTPVIAFGGSLGGMLAAWFRIKYPHIVDGALASSAPVVLYPNSNPSEFYMITSRTFIDSGCNKKAVERSWEVLEKLAKTKDGRAKLNKIFKLDPKKSLISKKEDVGFLKSFISNTMVAMTFVNFPYPNTFLANVPGWPVKKVCEKFRKIEKSDEKTAEQLYNILNLYYNYTGNKEHLCANHENCEGPYGDLGDISGWYFQACTEVILPTCSMGPPNDFFWNTCPFSIEGRQNFCNNTFGSIGYKKGMLRPNSLALNYGSSKFPTATNIIFSNGYLDPWSAYGYSKKNLLKGPIKSIILKTGAHHYDLRGADKLDTKEVKQVRIFEKNEIKKWIKEKKIKKN
ncbi:unnamed protein product [Caenorhabditis angaria]|uniref:Uncharacterized protein n=1 Tax=Caenorhabditis angaria TaxID=860376 RepID=A0A9P1ILY8_9PELO|nr:unnamed protein product [Caenorhabditis angaria]